MLGAVVAIAAGFLFAAPAAQAIPGATTHGSVTCTSYTNVGANYPGNTNFLICEHAGDTAITTQTKNGWFGVISGETPDAKNRLQDGTDVRFYIFKNEADYVSYFTADGTTPVALGDNYGVSSVGQNYSVIVRQINGQSVPNDIIIETIAHEAGHHLDYRWGANVYSTTRASDTANFISLREHDIWLLNNKWVGANAAKRPPCGPGGALVNLYDPVNEKYVCSGYNLEPEYKVNGNQTENYTVLKLVFPDIDGKPELFAVSFSVVSGNRSNWHQTWGTAARMIQAEFSCTNAMVSSLRIRNAEPGTPPGSAYSYNCTRSLPAVPWP
jgi:hypothetical protein